MAMFKIRVKSMVLCAVKKLTSTYRLINLDFKAFQHCYGWADRVNNGPLLFTWAGQ